MFQSFNSQLDGVADADSPLFVCPVMGSDSVFPQEPSGALFSFCACWRIVGRYEPGAEQVMRMQ
jgi:hypothetical protein